MDDGEEAGRRVRKGTARIIGSVVPMIVLLWVFHEGYKLATETRDTETGGSQDGYIALVFGVVTMVFGLIYVIIGLTIVAELALDWLAWLQLEDMRTTNNPEKEPKTICRIFIQTSATMVSLFMLTWAIYNGYKLAAEAPNVIIYNRIAFLIGVITMAFGFIYFVIGIALVADSQLCFSGRLQQAVDESYIGLDTKTDANFAV